MAEPDGTRVAIRVDHYLDESARTMRIGGKTLTNFHRALSTYLNTFIRTGFVLRQPHEPRPSATELAQYPELSNELRAPSFIIYDLAKGKQKARSPALPRGLTLVGIRDAPERG